VRNSRKTRKLPKAIFRKFVVCTRAEVFLNIEPTNIFLFIRNGDNNFSFTVGPFSLPRPPIVFGTRRLTRARNIKNFVPSRKSNDMATIFHFRKSNVIWPVRHVTSVTSIRIIRHERGHARAHTRARCITYALLFYVNYWKPFPY